MNIRSMRNPDLYHGRTGKTYFEGWYFKLVDASRKHTFAFIPGIFFNIDPENSHAFIQIVDGIKRTYRYERFSANHFSAEKNYFSIAIEGSRFGREGISFNLEKENANLKGEVLFKNHFDWPDNIINPGSMGFYNYILKMQCYSQVCSMDFDLDGDLEIDGHRVDFAGGKGYMEKNWGSAFPYSWVWVQCNHFTGGRASLSCSLAHIPFLFTSFRGFLAGMLVDDQFYKFTTMNHSRSNVVQNGTDINLEFQNGNHILSIECKTKSEDFILLKGPRGDQMIPLVQENLQGTVQVELKETGSGKVIFSDTGRCAGVEYGGEQMMILD